MSDDVDLSRRHFLGVATAVTGGVGAVFAAVPFLASWQPSARAQALGAPVEVDIGKLEPGAMVKVEWRGKPVWLLRRSDDMLERVGKSGDQLRDPDSEQPQQPEYAKNEFRSIKPEILVVVGSCTHLGCSPIERFDVAPADLGADWEGGFYCPCHGSTFDLAGRVYKGVPAPLNLAVPPHRYLSDSVVLIGADSGVA
ncbi:MAG: ubiquinol-cytochrome c reductase iron-sulfur subunit [Gammaproteobacteria bacterium]|jgi:ubiquinol-cytochrome c reductase iron-sulfur subunit